MAEQQEKQLTIITASRKGAWSACRQLWGYRALFVYLFKQTAVRRFQDTILGPVWLLLRPLIPSIAVIVIFSRIVPISTGDLPYPVFYFGGYLLWGLFASIVAFVPRAMRMNRGMMKKMYFPRLLIPMASLGIPLAEFLVTLGVFAGVIIYYAAHGSLQFAPGPELMLFPLLVLMTVALGVGIGMIVGVLSLVARDVLYTLPYFLQVWMLMTPVIYGIDFMPEKWRWIIYILNPMATLVETGKASLLTIGSVDWLHLGVAAAWVIAVMTLSTMLFLRAEDIFMDDI